jgi:hypothetical protein
VLTLGRRARADPVDDLVTDSIVDDRPPPRCLNLRPDDSQRIARWTVGGTLVGFVPFVLVLWDFGVHPLRTAGAHRFASNLYDLQARAFLDGDLAVPANSLGIEGFVIDGRTYMYFPPFPALLRLPVLILTHQFDGRLTAVSMLLGWIVLAGAAAALFWTIRMLLRGDAPVSRVEGFAAATFVASITGGSVIVFDAALPWVYHEVYIWASAFGIGTLAGLVAAAWRPGPVVVAATGCCAIGAILTRTTTGWALATTVIVAGAISMYRRKTTRRYGLGLIAGGVTALVLGVAFNWAKFRHPFMFPLEHQEWTRQNARRRLALMMNGGSITGPQFFVTSLVNYLRPDGIRFVSYFPFVTLPATPARGYGGAFLDQSYRTGSVPAFMPLLFVASLWGFVVTAVLRPWTRLVALAVPLLGALLVCAGVMGYGYLAHRYTSEFIPVLAIGGAIGIVDLAHRVERGSARARRAIAVLATTLALFGVLANTAIGLTAARIAWRGDRLAAYVAAQATIGNLSGGALAPPVSWSDSLPDTAQADTLQIVGDCDALYVATGDQYEPWVLVAARRLTARVTVGSEGTRAGVARLFTIDGARQRHVTLETSPNNRFRLRVGEGSVYLPTEWRRTRPGESFEISVAAETERDRFRVGISGNTDEFVNAAEWNSRWIHLVSRARLAVPSARLVDGLGVSISESRGPRPELCDELLRDLRR